MPEQQQSNNNSQQSNNSPLVSGDTIAGGIMNIAGTALNNMFARQRESDARAENYEYNEKAAENAYQRQLNYYDTRMSPAALLAQYREAGLSPSLMFGGGGVGGGTATAPQGQGSSGVSPNVFGMNLLESAQVGLMQAQTRKLNAEADTEQGLNERGQSEIENIIQSTKTALTQAGLNEASTALTNAETGVQELLKKFKNETFWADVEQANATAEKVSADAREAAAKVRITEKEAELIENTFDDQAKQIRQQTRLLARQILLTGEQAKLTNAEVQKIQAEVQKIAYDMQLAYYEADLHQRELKIDAAYKEAVLKLNKADLHLKFDEQEIERWKVKVNAYVSTIQTFIGAIGLGAAAKIRKGDDNKMPTNKKKK